jgi:hypothetical protein
VKKPFKKILFVFLLTVYIFVGFVAGYCHDHEIDGSFHDNCPACQWEIQTYDNDRGVDSSLHIVVDLTYSIHVFKIIPFFSTSQDYYSVKTSRAPPRTS